jgi:integrase
MKVNRLAERFFQHAAQTNAPGSLQGIRDRLRLFLNEFGEVKTTKVSRERLIEFLHQSQGTLADQTHRQNILRVEALQGWAVRFEYLKKPWIRKGDVHRPPAVGRDMILTLEQVAAIIAIMRKDAVPIFRCCRLTGSRPGELCAARIEQIEGPPGERLIVQTKHKTAKKTGQKRRIILTPAAEELVDIATAGRTEGAIFLTARGLPWLRDRLSREFRRCRDHLGISKKIVLYSTRHEAASRMIDAGCDINQVKVQLGHTDIGTTQRYVHAKDETVRRAAMAIADVKPLAEAG